MPQDTDAGDNIRRTRDAIGYLPRKNATPQLYADLGFKCGLEIHQQLRTEKKLFCRCPAGIYQKEEEYDAELVRHMRPTLSELGEYDGTALMEFKTRKNIFYRIKAETACTYDFDDTPPFHLNMQALESAMEVALLLGCSIVGELHITRKQYLDGSIPAGFQRTAIVGIEGSIPLGKKTIRIIQLSLEEDACREVSDVGHERVYTTDRLGIPLIETVTYPDMTTPDEAAEVGNYLRFLARSTGKVNTGIGAARQDVNVSITGGTRVEIKGVQHIKWIPDLTHNEAFRQKALLEIREVLRKRISDIGQWTLASQDFTDTGSSSDFAEQKEAGLRIVVVRLPQFGGLLSFFTSPGRVFADEIADRLKVIACLEKPNMTHSEDPKSVLGASEWIKIRKLFGKKTSSDNPAWIVFWGPKADIQTAIETISERCRLTFEGVPNETRKSRPDGTTVFERVLPGPDRMYPDTDSAPIPIEDDLIESIRAQLPSSISDRVRQMEEWSIPRDAHAYILRRNLFDVILDAALDGKPDPKWFGALLGHTLRHAEGQIRRRKKLNADQIRRAIDFVREQKMYPDILKSILPVWTKYPEKDLEAIIRDVGFETVEKEEILARIPQLREEFILIRKSHRTGAEIDWIMGRLRTLALGNMDMRLLRKAVEGGAA